MRYPAVTLKGDSHMSGLLALLDDVAGIAKIAAASVDDVIAQASKAGAKAAGAVIDDAAVTPKYVTGFSAERELPIVWKIARGSILNKLLILTPAALLLSVFAPWLIAPLLMLGGAYLCFEGAEKILKWLRPGHVDLDAKGVKGDPAHLEEQKVKGAIKTDFILSAEIMTIALSALPAEAGLVFKGAALVVVAIGITALVYGAVAIIVKADDVGLHMSARGGVSAAIGRGIVKGMPTFMKLLLVVGTAAMLWVGGSIIVHAWAEMGWHAPEHLIDDAAHAVAAGSGGIEWTAKAIMDGVLGIILGFALIPLVEKALTLMGRAH